MLERLLRRLGLLDHVEQRERALEEAARRTDEVQGQVKALYRAERQRRLVASSENAGHKMRRKP